MSAPKYAERLLSFLLPEYSRDAILGDMQESFAQIELERGAAAARRWYWLETLAAVPRFAIHTMQNTQIRRQVVTGTALSDNWFAKQNSGMIAAIGFLLVLPTVIGVGWAVLYFTAGPATAQSLPGSDFIFNVMETGFISIGAMRFPVAIIFLVGLFFATLMNVFAQVNMKFERVKDVIHAHLTFKPKVWNLILLGLILLLGLGLDALIS